VLPAHEAIAGPPSGKCERGCHGSQSANVIAITKCRLVLGQPRSMPEPQAIRGRPFQRPKPPRSWLGAMPSGRGSDVEPLLERPVYIRDVSDQVTSLGRCSIANVKFVTQECETRPYLATFLITGGIVHAPHDPGICVDFILGRAR
jgi:hypothetical protein